MRASHNKLYMPAANPTPHRLGTEIRSPNDNRRAEDQETPDIPTMSKNNRVGKKQGREGKPPATCPRSRHISSRVIPDVLPRLPRHQSFSTYTRSSTLDIYSVLSSLYGFNGLPYIARRERVHTGRKPCRLLSALPALLARRHLLLLDTLSNPLHANRDVHERLTRAEREVDFLPPEHPTRRPGRREVERRDEPQPAKEYLTAYIGEY